MTHSAAMSRANAIELMKADLVQAIALASLLEFDDDGGVPEWIHLLPKGVANSIDDREPWQALNLERLAKASLEAAGGRLPVDENHSTDYAAPHGSPAPARGWIVQLEARETGLWGKVEWTPEGVALLKNKSYRHISPVFLHNEEDRVITLVLRAALTNNPGFRQLTALNSANASKEENMDFMERLRAALGLSEDADEAAVLKAIKTKPDAKKDDGGEAEKLTAQLSAITKAAGLDESVSAEGVVSAVETLAAGNAASDATAIATLQSELVTMTTNFNTLSESVGQERAEAVVDAAIEEGTVGVKGLRDHFIKRFIKNPDEVKTELAALPKVPAGALLTAKPPKDKDGKPGLDETQLAVAKQLGITPEKYTETLAAERAATQESV